MQSNRKGWTNRRSLPCQYDLAWIRWTEAHLALSQEEGKLDRNPERVAQLRQEIAEIDRKIEKIGSKLTPDQRLPPGDRYRLRKASK